MGKASSSKKVARAAGIGGGRASRGRRPWGYYAMVAVIVILGLLGTWVSRNHRLAQINNRGNSAPTVGTTWYEGYGVYECGTWAKAISHAKDPQGITTGNGDGIIHIHPTVKAAAGKNATLGKFAGAVGMKLNAAELQVPGGKLYTDGATCEGKPGHVYVKQFDYVGDNVGTLETVTPTDVPLSDGALVTIAFVPASDKGKIPPPPAYVQTNLTKLSASTSPTTTTPTTVKPTTPTTVKPTSSTTASTGKK